MSGARKFLRKALHERELREPDDFAIVNLKATAYKESDSKVSQVFVVGWDESIEHVAEQSYTITAMKDRPESESLRS
jgi:hypothetical protein